MPTSLGNTCFAVCIKSKTGGLNQRFPKGGNPNGGDRLKRHFHTRSKESASENSNSPGPKVWRVCHFTTHANRPTAKMPCRLSTSSPFSDQGHARRLNKKRGTNPALDVERWSVAAGLFLGIDHFAHLENRQEHANRNATDGDAEEYDKDRLDQGGQAREGGFNLLIEIV